MSEERESETAGLGAAPDDTQAMGPLPDTLGPSDDLEASGGDGAAVAGRRRAVVLGAAAAVVAALGLGGAAIAASQQKAQPVESTQGGAPHRAKDRKGDEGQDSPADAPDETGGGERAAAEEPEDRIGKGGEPGKDGGETSGKGKSSKSEKDDKGKSDKPSKANKPSGDGGAKPGKPEKPQSGRKWGVVKEAWDEKVVDKAAWTEKKLVKAAWTETVNHPAVTHVETQRVDSGRRYWVADDGTKWYDHVACADYCYDNGLAYSCFPIYEEKQVTVTDKAAWTETVNHEAEYQYVDHPATYKTVHHPAEMGWV